MITLLKKFGDESDVSKSRVKYGAFLGKSSGIIYGILFVLKLVCTIVTGSACIFADGVCSLSNLLTSLIQASGYSNALKENDSSENSSISSESFEYINGIVAAMLMFAAAILCLGKAVTRMSLNACIKFPTYVIVIIVASIFINVYMFSYQMRCAEKLNSSVFLASAYDALTCSVISTVVLVCAILSEHFRINIDGISGLIIGLYIVYKAVILLKDSVLPLVSQEENDSINDKIAQFIMSYDDILGIHDLKTQRCAGGKMIVTLHAEVSADGNMTKLNDTIDNIERKLEKTLDCMAVIHMDPVTVNDEDTFRMMRFCTLMTKSIDEQLSIRGFRMSAGPTHINVIYDILVPQSVTLKDDEIIKSITQKITSIPGNLYPVIDIEHI